MINNKEIIEQQISSYEYTDPDNSFFRTAFGIGVYQPLAESYIKNAYAKNTGSALYNAMNNGGYYSNYTFLGGNQIFGGENSILKKMPGIKKIFNQGAETHKTIFRNKKGFGFQYVSPKENTKYSKPKGIKEVNDVFESGFGIGRKIELSDIDKNIFNNIFSKYSPEEFKKLNHREIIENYLSKNIINGEINDAAKTIIGKEAIENIEFLKRIKGQNHGYGTYKKLSKIFNVTIKEGKEISKIINENGIDDIVKKIINKSSSKYIDNFVNIVNKETSSSFLEKAFGNKAAMFLLGIGGGPIVTALQIGLGVASAISSMHQERTINNFVSNRLSNYNETAFIESQKGAESLYSNYMINQSNYDDFVNIYSNRNVSKESLRGIDPINIDSTLSNKNNFTIF